MILSELERAQISRVFSLGNIQVSSTGRLPVASRTPRDKIVAMLDLAQVVSSGSYYAPVALAIGSPNDIPLRVASATTVQNLPTDVLVAIILMCYHSDDEGTCTVGVDISLGNTLLGEVYATSPLIIQDVYNSARREQLEDGRCDIIGLLIPSRVKRFEGGIAYDAESFEVVTPRLGVSAAPGWVDIMRVVVRGGAHLKGAVAHIITGSHPIVPWIKELFNGKLLDSKKFAATLGSL